MLATLLVPTQQPRSFCARSTLLPWGEEMPLADSAQLSNLPCSQDGPQDTLLDDGGMGVEVPGESVLSRTKQESLTQGKPCVSYPFPFFLPGTWM